MTNEIVKKSFVFNSTQIRTAIIDGEPWFVAKDVCDVLEIQNVTQALETLDGDEKMTLSKTEGHSGQRGGAQFLNPTYMSRIPDKDKGVGQIDTLRTAGGVQEVRLC